MGTSLSGLTPATTFDGLLKTSDNEPIGATLKTISDGSGVDSVLQLSNSALSIGGDTTIETAGTWVDGFNSNLRLESAAPSIQFKNTGGTSGFMIGVTAGSTIFYQSSSADFGSVNSIGRIFGGRWSFGVGTDLGASVGIKGNGATSATTSLLVQNSAGSDLLRVRDDGHIVIPPFRQLRGDTSDSAITLQGSTSMTFRSATKDFDFDTQNGTIVSFKNDGDVGIGETTPTARLHIKGSGNTDATSSLIVQNSDGVEMLNIEDDNNIAMGPNGAFMVNANSKIYTKGDGFLWRTSSDSYIATMTSAGLQIGNSSANATARLQVKGTGATSATTALLVQNSAGSDMLKVTDDGIVRLGTTGQEGVINLNRSSNGGKVGAIKAVTNGLYLSNGDDSNQILVSNSASSGIAIGNGPSFMNAALGVKGSGATSATTALLVKNSAGTDLLKVEDGGVIGVNGFTIESNTIKPRVNGFIGINHNDNRNFSIIDSNGTRNYLKVQSSSTSNFADVSVNTDHLVVKKEGNVAVGTSTLDTSAKLQVDSTTQGFLPPRMTFDQRNAIATPAIGLIVYQTDGAEGVYVNTSTGWKQMQLIG